MALTYGFFNSMLKNGVQDRVYNADQMSTYFRGLISDGVYQNIEGGLQVKASTGMTVQIMKGRAVLDSRWMENTSVIDITLNPSHVTLNRYTAIVMRVDYNERNISIVAKDGANATTPTRPSMTRTSLIKEYCLAYIYVGRGITTITQSAITDTRPNDSLCGFITGLVKQLNTTELFNQYQTAFNEWFSTVKETLAKSTLIRQYTSSYTTTATNESVIPINIPQFNKELDILNVFINGMKLIQGVDYIKNNNTQITLTKSLCAGASVEFEIFKSIDGSDAETVVQQVYQLQTRINNINPTPLYKSENGTFPNAAIEIIPSKPLASCQHGWELIFTGYDDNAKVGKDFYTQTVHIPKRSYKGADWAGESMTFSLVYSYNQSTYENQTCTKTFTIYPTKIVSSQYNSQGKNRNMVLRAIYEY